MWHQCESDADCQTEDENRDADCASRQSITGCRLDHEERIDRSDDATDRSDGSPDVIGHQEHQTQKDEGGEWQKEVHALDEDKTFSLRSYKDLERRRDEIDQKLEQYKLKDEVEAIVEIIPSTQQLLEQSWKQTADVKGIKRLGLFTRIALSRTIKPGEEVKGQK